MLKGGTTKKKSGYSRIRKTQLQHIKNAAIGYSYIFMAAFPNTAYAVTPQALAGTQSCVFKNAAQTGVCSCVLGILELRFFTNPDATSIAAFPIKTQLQVTQSCVSNAAQKQLQARFCCPGAAFFPLPNVTSIATFPMKTQL